MVTINPEGSGYRVEWPDLGLVAIVRHIMIARPNSKRRWRSLIGTIRFTGAIRCWTPHLAWTRSFAS